MAQVESATHAAICQAALGYVRQGFAVLPVFGKRPAVRSWTAFRQTAPTSERVAAWYAGSASDLTEEAREHVEAGGALGVGIILGSVSGLLVVDRDPRNDRDGAGERWRRSMPFPTTARADSGGGGLHLYFRLPTGFQGKGKATPASGVEVLSDGHYVVAPPSAHPSGGVYTWRRPLSRIADAPDSLLALLTPDDPTPDEPRAVPTLAPSTDASGDALHAYAARALQEETDRVRAAPEGERNDTLNRAAHSLGKLVGASALDRAEVERELLAAATACGLPASEAKATIRSGLNAGASDPRDLSQVGRTKLLVLPSARGGGGRDGEPVGVKPDVKEEGVIMMNDVSEFYGSVAWLWADRIPAGHVTLIVGETGVGKSHLAAHLIAAIAGAQPFPDGSRAPKTGRVLLIETEDFRGAYAQRLRALRVPEDAILLPAGDRTEPTYVPNLLRDEQMIERIASRHEVAAILVDSLSGGHSLDENTADMRRVLQTLTALAGKVGVPVIAVHHLRKRSVHEPVGVSLDRIRGSSVIAQFCRSVIALWVPDADSGTVRADCVKASFCPKPLPFAFDILQEGLAFVPVPEEPRPRTARDDAVDFLRLELAGGGKTRVELVALAGDVGIAARTLDRAKLSIGVRVEDGRWTLPT